MTSRQLISSSKPSWRRSVLAQLSEPARSTQCWAKSVIHSVIAESIWEKLAAYRTPASATVQTMRLIVVATTIFRQDVSFGLKASLMHELPACRLSCSDLMGTYGSRVIRTPYAGARGSIASGCLRGGLAALVCGAAFQVAHAASRLTSCRSARQYFLVLFLWSLGCSDYWDGFCSRKADLSSARLRCTALELGAEGEGRQSP